MEEAIRDHSGTVISTTARHIRLRLSNILNSHRCSTILRRLPSQHRTITPISHHKEDTSSLSTVLSNPHSFRTLTNPLMVTVGHPINMLPSSGLDRSSMVLRSLTTAVAVVVDLSTVVEDLKPH
jgi:hypothetical protein